MEQPPPPPPESPPPAGPHDRDAKNWAVGCHLSAFAGVVVPYVGNWLGPLIIWLLKRDADPLIDEHGKESLNFQISMTIYLVIASFLMIVLIGFLLVPVLAILDIVLVIVAAVKTSNGEPWRYPLTIRLIK